MTAEIEVYEGTLHGWCPPDPAAFHEAQAEDDMGIVRRGKIARPEPQGFAVADSARPTPLIVPDLLI
ncbi:hypothetical protein F7C95_14730 [Opitutia bacterium ISCC 51]|nr:hypothetical protein F7C95_14730 [Opitutae bacterium ISCC 51]QXD27248.1 hypothetical protein GA003_14640 [Opitutae bacterium ISCC 52]